MCKAGQNHTCLDVYGVHTYGILSRDSTIHTVIYGADARFWPNLAMCVRVGTCIVLCLLVRAYVHSFVFVGTCIVLCVLSLVWF